MSWGLKKTNLKKIEQSNSKIGLFTNLGFIKPEKKKCSIIDKKINNFKLKKENKNKAIESQTEDYFSQQKNQEFVVNQLTNAN